MTHLLLVVPSVIRVRQIDGAAFTDGGAFIDSGAFTNRGAFTDGDAYMDSMELKCDWMKPSMVFDKESGAT